MPSIAYLNEVVNKLEFMPCVLILEFKIHVLAIQNAWQQEECNIFHRLMSLVLITCFYFCV